jgi:predicted Ser/Thr protein kinase
MAYATDGLVGKLALQKGWINSAQLKEALAEQSTLQRTGQRRPLGVILVSRGALTDERLLDLLEEQRKLLAENAANTQVRKEDFLFGQILLKQGVATSDQINSALRAQAELVERGEVDVPRLGQILMEMGVSDAKAVGETLKIQYKTLYVCPGCRLRYNLVKAAPDKQYRCRKCGAILEAKPSDPDLKADQSAYGMNLEVAEDLPPEVAQADLDPANRFDKFILLEPLGRGGAGTVFRAYQKDLRRVIALKLLRAPDEETLQRFAREARTAARLKHPGIVAVYETGTYNNVPFLAMEFIEGRPLESLGKLPFRQAAQLARDVSLAVHYAHEQGVLHRDLKPQNILVDKDMKPFVTDFGLARPIEGGKDLTLTGMVVGTPAYMSPEQAQGRRDLDGRSDVCALGAILYELLTGLAPYTGKSPVDIALAVVHSETVPPRRREPTVPADLEAICLKAMAKERERRYASAKALAEDLQRFAEGEPILARRANVLSSTVRRLARNPGRSAVAAGALLGALVIALVLVALLTERPLRGSVPAPPAPPSEEERRAASRREAEALLAEAGPAAPADRRLAVATRALGLCPDLEAAFVVRALAHIELGHEEAAYEDLGRAAERSPNALPHWMSRADLARRLGRPDDEIADLGRALALNPLAGTLRLQRAAAAAQRSHALLDAARPEDADLVARLLVQAGDDLAAAGSHALLEGVRRGVDAALQKLPRVPVALRRPLATAFAERAFASCPLAGSVARAAQAACDCDVAWAPALAARALAAYLDGRDGPAVDDAGRALDLLPSLPEALAVRALARLRRAAASGQAAAFADGAVDLSRFLAQAPDRPALRPLRDLAATARPELPAHLSAEVRPLLAARVGELRAAGDAAAARRLEDFSAALSGSPSRNP